MSSFPLPTGLLYLLYVESTQKIHTNNSDLREGKQGACGQRGSFSLTSHVLTSSFLQKTSTVVRVYWRVYALPLPLPRNFTLLYWDTHTLLCSLYGKVFTSYQCFLRLLSACQTILQEQKRNAETITKCSSQQNKTLSISSTMLPDQEKILEGMDPII